MGKIALCSAGFDHELELWGMMMGLDVYVGSFTRYLSRDWETVMEQYARETGMSLQIIRPHEPADMITDPEEIRPLMLLWRDQLNKSLSEHLEKPMDWDEGPESPYFTDKPAWDAYLALVAWAAYSEHPDLDRPTQQIEDLDSDPAFIRSAAADSDTKYAQLVSGVEIWLPFRGPRVFSGPGPTGDPVLIGSIYYLLDELNELNRQTWGADEAQLAQWRFDGAPKGVPLEEAARFGMGLFHALASSAVEHGLPMKLDY